MEGIVTLSPASLTTLDDQIRCVAREVELRKLVYPARVRDGKMSEYAMTVEIARMEAVLKTLQEALKQRRRAREIA